MTKPKQLIDNMNRVGVHFLIGEGKSDSTTYLSPAELLAGLAKQSDARLRLALIAVLLQRPDFATDAHQALVLMHESKRLLFKLHFTAAYYLQKVYANQFRDVLNPYLELPDYYSEELNVGTKYSYTDQLKQLAEIHKEITGLPINWYGTYNSTAQRVITRLKKERAWATT